jgi:hypothetical protein
LYPVLMYCGRKRYLLPIGILFLWKSILQIPIDYYNFLYFPAINGRYGKKPI